FYFGGAVAFILLPLAFFIVLRPDRVTLRDTIWPEDPGRRQALLLFIVPLVLPPVVNLICHHRLTPLWTFPNWALLPVILFGSPRLNVPAIAAARACLAALAVSLAAAMVSPMVARAHLAPQLHTDAAHYRQVAAAIVSLANSQSVLIGGSEDVVQGLFYYLPAAWPMSRPPPNGSAAKS